MSVYSFEYHGSDFFKNQIEHSNILQSTLKQRIVLVQNRLLADNIETLATYVYNFNCSLCLNK